MTFLINLSYKYFQSIQQQIQKFTCMCLSQIKRSISEQQKIEQKINLMKQRFVINSVASFKDINSSSLNRSATKQTFSFGKTSRFTDAKPVCQNISYGGDFIKHRPQATGIGYGKRSDFTQCNTVSPACSKYNLFSQIQINKKRSRGSTMGLGREAVVFNQYVPREARRVPSSTHYNYDKVQKVRSPSFTMRNKTKMLDRSMTLDPERDNPGPGSYYQPRNSTRVSKFSDIAYGTSRDRRFSNPANGVPGAGHYQNQEPISGTGKYNNSKHLGGTPGKFSKTPRTTFFDQAKQYSKNRPGPGFYKQPSQFGQYDGNVYGETALRRYSRVKS